MFFIVKNENDCKGRKLPEFISKMVNADYKNRVKKVPTNSLLIQEHQDACRSCVTEASATSSLSAWA
jgi:hypothetical protein